jgi:AraC-like DNA-binding protein
MDIKDFIKANIGCSYIEEGVAVIEINNCHNIDKRLWTFFHCQILIVRGALKVEIDSNKLELLPCSFAEVMVNRSFQIFEASTDILAYEIIYTDRFISDLFKDRPPFPLKYVTDRTEQPIILLSLAQTSLLAERFKILEQQFDNSNHYFRSDMVRCSIWMLMMDIANIFYLREKETKVSSKLNRKHTHLIQFMNLLQQDIKQKHSVGFYASELCVTPQYLARIVKELTGKTVFEWIQNTLLGEISRQLKDSRLNLQQISDDYGFPDQATFSKFFKRYTGMTPSEYRWKNTFVTIS